MLLVCLFVFFIIIIIFIIYYYKWLEYLLLVTYPSTQLQYLRVDEDAYNLLHSTNTQAVSGE